MNTFECSGNRPSQGFACNGYEGAIFSCANYALNLW